MDKIEVGEYIRTKKGVIAKCEYFDKKSNSYWFDKVIVKIYGEAIDFINKNEVDNKYILKHSKNKIELIEEGDYVNGMEVYKGKTANGGEKLLAGNHIINGMALELVNIKSIVTHEQFESVKYDFEEE